MNRLNLSEKLRGNSVVRPNKKGELSGHAAGEPFSDLTFDILEDLGYRVQKQHSYLNTLFKATNPSSKTERLSSVHVQSLAEVLWTGRINKKWTHNEQFDYKQGDFADMLILDSDMSMNIIDVKTTNLRKKSQPPNIISALRLANICKSMLNHEEFDKFTITYIGIGWSDHGERLICEDVNIIDLFKIQPTSLYINFTASLQIQFKLDAVDQTFNGSKKQWCLEYIHHFITSHEERTKNFYRANILPFVEILEQWDF